MRVLRRVLPGLAAGLVAAVPLPAIAGPDSHSNRPLRIIVSFPPGSAPDTVARILGNKLTGQLGQHVIADARPGASGVIAAEIAKNAPPDGHTLLLVGTTLFATLPALRPKLSYDPDKDFIALSRIASVVNVVAVHPSIAVATVADLVKAAKASAVHLNYGSSGNGSAPHVAGEMFNVLAGVKTVHVPYKGAVLALNELIAGQLQFMITTPIIVMPHAKSARIRLIATTGAKRDPFLPELPTVADTLPGFESTLWWGLAVPAKTPAAVVTRLHAEIVKAAQSAEVRELLARQGASAHGESPAEFAAFIKAERERIGRIGRQVSITLD